MILNNLSGNISIKGEKNSLSVVNRVNSMRLLYSSLYRASKREIAEIDLVARMYEAILKMHDTNVFENLEEGIYYVTFEMSTKKKLNYYIAEYDGGDIDFVKGYNILPFIVLIDFGSYDNRKEVNRIVDEVTTKVMNADTETSCNHISKSVSDDLYDLTKFCIKVNHDLVKVTDVNEFAEQYTRKFVNSDITDKVADNKKERKRTKIQVNINQYKKGDFIDKEIIDNNALLCSCCNQPLHINKMYNGKRTVLRCDLCKYDAEIFSNDNTADKVMLLSTAASSDTRCARMVAHKIIELLKNNNIIDNEADIYADVKNKIYDPTYNIADVHIGNMQKAEVMILIRHLLDIVYKNGKNINTRVELSSTAFSWIKRNLGDRALKAVTVYNKYKQRGMLESQSNSEYSDKDSIKTVSISDEITQTITESNYESNTADKYKSAEERAAFRRLIVIEHSETINDVLSGKKDINTIADNSNKKDKEDTKVETVEAEENNDNSPEEKGTNVSIELIRQIVNESLQTIVDNKLEDLDNEIKFIKSDIKSINTTLATVNNQLRIDKSLQKQTKSLQEKCDKLAKDIHNIKEFNDGEMKNNILSDKDFSKKIIANLIK